MKTHSGEKTFYCTQCNYAAAEASSLKTHMWPWDVLSEYLWSCCSGNHAFIYYIVIEDQCDLKKWYGSSQLPGVIIYESVQLALFVIADTHKIKKGSSSSMSGSSSQWWWRCSCDHNDGVTFEASHLIGLLPAQRIVEGNDPTTDIRLLPLTLILQHRSRHTYDRTAFQNLYTTTNILTTVSTTTYLRIGLPVPSTCAIFGSREKAPARLLVAHAIGINIIKKGKIGWWHRAKKATIIMIITLFLTRVDGVGSNQSTPLNPAAPAPYI